TGRFRWVVDFEDEDEKESEDEKAPGKIPFDLVGCQNYVAGVQKGNASTFDSPRVRFVMRMPVPQFFTNYLGRKLFRLLLTIQGLGAFALITLGVMIKKFGAARH